jgi:hypothetical protein
MSVRVSSPLCVGLLRPAGGEPETLAEILVVELKKRANRIDILWPENRSRMRTIDSITHTERPLLWNFSFRLGTESDSERSKSTMPRAQQRLALSPGMDISGYAQTIND